MSYMVKNGDTLWDIAIRNKTTVENLANLNNISDPKRIHVGQVLRLSGNKLPDFSKTETGSKPMPTAPTYDSTKWDDTDAGKAALGSYQNAQNAVNNHGDFQYANQGQLDEIMQQILNRKDFSYDINQDAFYQQYKDMYTKQGQMAMQDTMGQAAALTGGYGNSYAATVGNQAYQESLDKLNDIIPELYQMAYDRYNQKGHDLLNQYGLLQSDYERAYGEHQDEYNKLMDALGIARSDYYDGADMFHTEQSNKNSIAGQEFNDAMSIWQGETDQAWKNAEWDEASGSDSGNKPTGTNKTSSVPDSVISKAKGYTTEKGQADYLASEVNKGNITQDQAIEILNQHGVTDLVNRSWELVDDGGINWFGVGIDADAKVSDGTKTYTLAELRKELKKTMTTKEANAWIKDLEKKLGI